MGKKNHNDYTDTDNNKSLKKQMDIEIFKIAYYRGIMLSKYSLIFMLIFFYTFLTYKEAPTMSIIYILILVFFLPMFVQAFYSSMLPKKEAIIFASLCKKYDYTTENKRNQSFALLIIYLILMLWQKSYTPKYQVINFAFFPTYILVASILLRIILTLFYFFYIKKNLRMGRMH